MDITIAQQASLRNVGDLAVEKLGIDRNALEMYGHYKAKISLDYVDSLQKRQDGKLVLVTAISPTPAGEGKTTTTVGLGDALNLANKKTLICLREPSLGPCFGFKGGGAGGGYAQIAPMEDINLHFTGDIHAVTLAHNLLSALVDNHIQHGNELKLDVRRIVWRRVVDLNDRVLRNIVIGLGGVANGYPREGGFDITAASEVMAILCLSSSYDELKRRFGDIIVGYNLSNKPVTARDINGQGAMTALMRDALKPNIVQTLENNPVLVHGGPFANIAHGCNSAIATRAALKLADYVVTEAGFGADLGAEKFFDIKCRKIGLKPSAVVLVATVRALKFHGGVALADLVQENVAAVEKGMVNLERHLDNIRRHFNIPCVVAVNNFTSDTTAEFEVIQKRVNVLGTKTVHCEHWAKGGEGARELAEEVVRLTAGDPPKLHFAYEAEDTLWDKLTKVATKIYGAREVIAELKVRKNIHYLQENGYGSLPICIAKTQYSFSTDASLRGAPENHVMEVTDVQLSAGAGFLVAMCGHVMKMPGLPKIPAADKIDVDSKGNISGLF